MKIKCPCCKSIVKLDDVEIRIPVKGKKNTFSAWDICSKCYEELNIDGKRRAGAIVLAIFLLLAVLSYLHPAFFVGAILTLLLQNLYLPHLIKITPKAKSEQITRSIFQPDQIQQNWTIKTVSQEGMQGILEFRLISDIRVLNNFPHLSLVILNREFEESEEFEIHQRITETIEKECDAIVVAKHNYGNRLRWYMYSSSKGALTKKLALLSADLELSWGFNLDPNWEEYLFMKDATIN